MDAIFWFLIIVFILPCVCYIIGRYITKGYLSAKKLDHNSENFEEDETDYNNNH